MKIEQIEGLDSHLYELVAPLVMNPRILRQNNNYPFKTSRSHVWFVAVDGSQVLGFLPVEKRDFKAVINNYYVREESLELLRQLVKQAVEALKDYSWAAVSQVDHVPVFTQCGFTVSVEWKKYIKLVKE